MLAKVELRNGDTAAAEQDLERAAALALRSRSGAVLAHALTLIHYIIGVLYRKYDQARVWQALATAAITGSADAERARPQLLSDSCVVATGQQRHAEAVQLCQQAIEQQGQLTGPQSPEAAAYMNNRASAYRHAGQTELALIEYQRALTLLIQHSGLQHPLTTMTLRNLARMLYDSGKFQEAAGRYDEALALVEQRFGAEDPRLLDSLDGLVMATLRTRELGKARAGAERMAALAEKTFGPRHARTAAAYDALARVLYEQGQYAESLALRERTRPGYEQAKEDEDLIENLVGAADCLRELGRATEALPLLERAISLLQPAMEPLRGPDARFALARTLWMLGTRKQRRRAVDAAQKARSGYAQAGIQGSDRLATVDKWLAEHRAR
jgi:tetratricopeptide (TPR) repeat protein